MEEKTRYFDELYGPNLYDLYQPEGNCDNTPLKNLFVFEGPDGVGKTAISRMVYDKLKEDNYPVILIREPGTTEVGEQIRKILLDRDNPLPTLVQFNLFSAARAAIIDMVVSEPKKYFLMDRYIESTIIYQYLVPCMKADKEDKFGTSKIPIAKLYSLLRLNLVKGIWPRPRATFFIHRNLDIAWLAANEDVNVFEKQGISHYKMVYEGYSNLAYHAMRSPYSEFYYSITNTGEITHPVNHIYDIIERKIKIDTVDTCGYCGKPISKEEMFVAERIPEWSSYVHLECYKKMENIK